MRPDADLDSWAHWSVEREAWFLAPAAWVKSDVDTVVSELARRLDMPVKEMRRGDRDVLLSILDEFKRACVARVVSENQAADSDATIG